MQLKFPESRRLTFDADDLTHRWSRNIFTPFGSFQQNGYGRCKAKAADFWSKVAEIGSLHSATIGTISRSQIGENPNFGTVELGFRHKNYVRHNTFKRAYDLFQI